MKRVTLQYENEALKKPNETFKGLKEGDWFLDCQGYLVIKITNAQGFNIASEAGRNVGFLDPYKDDSFAEKVEAPSYIKVI